MIFNLPQRVISIRVLFVLAVFSLAFVSCRDGGQSETSSQQAPQRTNITGNSSPGNTNNSAPATTNQNTGTAGAEYHYICANNCEGSGANAAGSCPVCGEELVHNTAFHSGDQGASSSNPQIIESGDDFTSKITPLGDPGNNAPAAASGGSGFHYTCSAGCGGGGNAQGACPSCGAELVHNAAFHSGGGATATPGAPSQTAPSSGNKYPSVFNTPGGAPPANRINSSSGSGNGFHYICSAGCGGGGSGQGSCPSCGAALVHNDAFH